MRGRRWIVAVSVNQPQHRRAVRAGVLEDDDLPEGKSSFSARPIESASTPCQDLVETRSSGEMSEREVARDASLRTFICERVY